MKRQDEIESKLRVPLSPEPLSDARWGAIERNVFARLEAPSAAPRGRAPLRVTAWVAIAAALLLTASGALGARLFWRAPEPKAVSPGETPATLASPTPSAPAARMSVGGARLDLAPGAVVDVQGDDAIVQHAGVVDFDVTARGGKPPLVVSTKGARAESASGRFRVAVGADEATTVTVSSGEARVSASNVSSTLTAGSAWSSSASAPPIVASSAAPSHVAPPTPATASVSSAVAITDQARFERAESFERAEPDRAVAEYESIASAGGAWAANALFAEGRLQSERGRKEEAKRLLERYLAAYPAGPNAGDARALLERSGP